MSKEKDILVKMSAVISKRAKEKFKSNVEFADVCNINESSVRRILLGKQNISVKVLKNICEALEIKMSDLLKEIGH